MSLNKKTLLAGLLAVAGVAISNGAQAAPCPGVATLPDPTGISFTYDMGVSYSIDVLEYFQPGLWDCSAGTGTIDVLITTRSSGQTNPGGLPDPTTNEQTNPINGYVNGDTTGTVNNNNTWGGVASTTTALVSNLVTQVGSTPLLTFDQNETGASPTLQVALKIEIIDGVNLQGVEGAVLKTWSLDNVADGQFLFNPLAPDLTQLITSPHQEAGLPTAGDICIPDVLNKSNGDDAPLIPGDQICFNQNAGSGSFDYLVWFPTMDLSQWSDANNIFKATWYFYSVDDGGEEITLTNAFAPPTVPEPGSLALMGMALGALGFIGRRRKVF